MIYLPAPFQRFAVTHFDEATMPVAVDADLATTAIHRPEALPGPTRLEFAVSRLTSPADSVARHLKEPLVLGVPKPEFATAPIDHLELLLFPVRRERAVLTHVTPPDPRLMAHFHETLLGRMVEAHDGTRREACLSSPLAQIF